MKNYLLFLLAFLPMTIIAQTLTITPQGVRDSFICQIEVNYGDSVHLNMYDRWGRVIEKMLEPQKVTHSFIYADTIHHLPVATYYFGFWVGTIKKGATIVYLGTDIIHYQIHVKINPESIPAETFVLYPNPCKSDNLHLLLGKEWAEGELTIVSTLGYVIARIPASEVMNQPENLWHLPILPSGTYFVNLHLENKEISRVLRVE